MENMGELPSGESSDSPTSLSETVGAQKRIPNPLRHIPLAHFPPKKTIITLIILALGVMVVTLLPSNLRGALFQINPSALPPQTGVYFSRGYEAQPNERGSVILQAGETLTDFEGISLTFVVDAARADIVRVRRTAITQNFEISLDFPAPGVAHVALVGNPRQIVQGATMLEFELQLRDSSVNTTNNTITLRLLGTEYLVDGNDLRTVAHEGLITFVTSQNALSLPFVPHIRNIDPGIYPLVRNKRMVIRGKEFPPSPRVFLGSTPIPIVSASPTEVIAEIPDSTSPGTYAVSLESLLAEEKVVVFDQPGPSGLVDILEELMFINPNPVFFTPESGGEGIDLWIPVYNPLGANDPISGSVDLSRIGGMPNVLFGETTVQSSIGPGGVAINWYLVEHAFPSTVQTNVDYPITVRAENRAGTRDEEVEILQVRARTLRGEAPTLGAIETVPPIVTPGEDVNFFVDVSDTDGVNSLQFVSLRLTPIGGDIIEMQPTLSTAPNGAPLTTVPFTAAFTIPNSVSPGTYMLEVSARDRDGNEAQLVFPFTVGTGNAPQFSGRLETIPATARPEGFVNFFVGVQDPDGTNTIEVVTIDLIDIGAGVEVLQPTVDIGQTIGTVPVVFTLATSMQLPATLASGTYDLEVRAFDEDGLSASTVISLVVDASVAPGSAPEFSGRLDASPSTVNAGGSVDFFVGVQDPDGTNTIEFVTIDLVDIGGGIQNMVPTLDLRNVVGTIPVVFTLNQEFTLPQTVFAGTYDLEVRVVDVNGLSSTTTLPLIVATGGGGGPGGNAPQFSGRLEASPAIVALGGNLTFFAGVRDPDGTDTIRQVTIDLVDIGGSVIELKRTVTPVPGSTQPVVYSREFTLPSTVAAGVYSLRVEAFDKDGNNAIETISVTVSAVLQPGGIPSIERAFAVPDRISANDNASVFFTVEVEDLDGIQDIESVRIDLGPMDLGFEFLDLDTKSSTSEGDSGVFVSDKVKIPTTVRTGGYDLRVRVEDAQGNRATGKIRLTVGTLGGDAPSFRDSRFVPEVVRPGGEARLFVEVEDKNGIDTVTVIADFTELELDDLDDLVEELDDVINFPSGTVAIQNTFVSDDLDIPEDIQPGVYDIPLTAIDDTGNIVRAGARLRIERGGSDDGQDPQIDVQRSFQTPRVFSNDESGNGELHVLVHDPDNDVLTVIGNFGPIGRADSANVRDGVGDIALLCDESQVIVCMQPSVVEGLSSQWFVLDGISIPPTTIASSTPYMIEFTAIDSEGHIDRATIPVLVGGPSSSEDLKRPPKILTIVPVDEDELEIVLSAPLMQDSIERGGEQFRIQPTLDAFTELRVRRVSWDTAGRYLYLQTDTLVAGETYTFTILSGGENGIPPLLDIYGNPFSKDLGGSVVFIAFSPPGTEPVIESVKVVDPNHIDVNFATQVLPSSVHQALLPSRATLTSTVTGDEKDVLGGVLINEARTLRLATEKLREGDRYRLRIEDVLGSGLIGVPAPGAEKIFIAVFPRGDDVLGPLILPTADLNRDGRVDFADFALFSAVYDTEYDLADMQVLSPSGGNDPRNTDGETHPVSDGSPFNDIIGDDNTFGGGLPDIEL